MTTGTRWTRQVAGRRIDIIFALILLAALGIRVHSAVTREYVHDEVSNAIPLSKTISFTPGHVHLPLRGENHGALPAYVVKASGAIFGTSRLGYRSLHVLGGLCAIVLVFLLASEWYGPVAARWAAAFLAFNDYFLDVSSRATAHVPLLLLVTLAVWAFSRFLTTQRAAYIYTAAVSLGLAFYSKEHAALLVPVFGLTLLVPRYWRAFRSRHLYVAGAVFVLLLVPDFYWNMVSDPEKDAVYYSGQQARVANYEAHLRRVGGLGFSPYPLMFYERDLMTAVYPTLTGHELRDETPEYHSMNPALGLLLLAAVLSTTIRRQGSDHVRVLLLILFWGIFVFFSLIKKGNPPGRLDPVSWIWVEDTMMPAVIFAGARIAATTGRWRIPLWAFSGCALLYAVWMAG